MSDGDKEAMEFLEDYIKNEPYSLLWIDVLDNYGIYGRNILTFFAKCCNESFDRFSDTLRDLDIYAYGDYYEQKRLVKNSIKNGVIFALEC
jgi:hypothetical protein